MAISDAAINALPIGKDVYDDLTYCTSQWQEAAYKAVLGLPDPQESDSKVNWLISLVGNLAWAATVFFPPAAAVAVGTTVAEKVTYAGASAATKATSMIGATLAAGVVAELGKLDGDLGSPEGKRFLNRYLSSQVPTVLKEYAAEADSWVKTGLSSLPPLAMVDVATTGPATKNRCRVHRMVQQRPRRGDKTPKCVERFCLSRPFHDL
jgi:hypothetical protein